MFFRSGRVVEKHANRYNERNPMPGDIFHIEEQEGPFLDILQRVMRMVPEKDRNDVNLQRLIAFRLRVDGEVATREYLLEKIREVIQCAYTGSLYDYLKNDLEEKECRPDEKDPVIPDPPDVA
jgi:hypothetical protein